MRILSAQEAREVDRVAMQEQGVPGVTLMENAGRAVAEKVDSMADGGKVGILCGKGNNGGDGYACASFLNEMEIECELISIIPEGEITGDAKHFYDECKGKDIRFCHAQHVKEVDLGHFNLIVDGLLGTGISGDVKPDSAEWIEAMNSASSAILSIDIPSGINGTNGFVCGTAVQATATVTMEFLKQGIVVQPGKSLAGEITVADLGYPATAFENLEVKKKAFDEDFKAHYGLEETVNDLIEAKHELVIGGRNLRTIGNIPFAKKVDYILKPAGELNSYEVEVIQSLLNAESLKVEKDYAPRKGTPVARSSLGELYLPLDGLIDVEAEKVRLKTQLEKISKEIEKASAKLDNPKFTERAPEDVLQEAKDRLAEWQQKEEQTRESIEYLSEA